eukprot:scaffold22568_cov125-Cylindrotheca_fusiformis.AAC.24
MSGIAKEAASAFRRQVPRGAKSWGRSLPSISVSEMLCISILGVEIWVWKNAIAATKAEQTVAGYCTHIQDNEMTKKAQSRQS